MNRDLIELRSFTTQLAEQAGEVLKSYFGTELTRSIKSHEQDFATEADFAAEKLILAAIKETYPDDDIIAEESGKQGTGTTGYTWIINPLDGTWNFANKVENFGTMIALAYQDAMIVAAVNNPVKNLFAAAAAGQGVTLNDERIIISPRTSPATLQLVVDEVFAAESDPLQRMLLLKEKLNEHGLRPGKLRSAAGHVLDMLATKRDIDVSTFPGKVWDFASPSLLLAESGLTISNFHGHAWNWRRDTDGYIAHTPALQRIIFK